jgi:RimJ/RimL family protein N-acetyltransferase
VTDPLFETERLRVRRLRESDLEAMLVVYGDADAMRWVGDGKTLTREDAHRWLDVTERNLAARGYAMSAIEPRTGGRVIGFCGLVHPGGQAEPELKVALLRDHWGRGLATEAARGMLDWGAYRFGMQRVIATVAPQHRVSHRVLRRIGFREGAMRLDEDGARTQVFEWLAPTGRVFVYGTLKQGFRNFPVNHGQRVPGEFVSELALPLYVVGEYGLPWLVHLPGTGERVRGQLFEVDAPALQALDALERVDEPGWYARRPLRVLPIDGGPPVRAVAYFGSADRLASGDIHAGPLAEYTEAHQALYRKHV